MRLIVRETVAVDTLARLAISRMFIEYFCFANSARYTPLVAALSGVRRNNLVIDGVPFVDNPRQRHKRYTLILCNRAKGQLSAGGFEPARRVVYLPFELQHRSGLLFFLRHEMPIPFVPRLLLESCRQDQGTIHHCLQTVFVRQGCSMQMHGETQFHAVATLPGPTEDHVATRVRESGHRTSIHLYVAAPRPVRNAQFQIDIDGFGRRDKQSGPLLLWESSLLRNANAVFRPVHFRRDVEIDEYGLFIVKVDGVRQLGELLSPSAAAAPERIERLGENLG